MRTCAICGGEIDGIGTQIGVQRKADACRGCGDQWWIDYAEAVA